MRIAHFAIFAPHASGQYATVKDLILAERSLGVDAQFIDCGSDCKEKDKIREGLKDGEIETQPLNWAIEKADICIRHTSVPEEVYDKKPVLLAIHGRPESSFRLDQLGKNTGLISNIGSRVRAGLYKAIFTFWEEYVYYWQKIHGVKIHYVPAPVNLKEYSLSGKKFDFGKFNADINLVIADMWRDDTTPFNLIFGAQYFRDYYHSDTRLHIFGASSKKQCFSFLGRMQKSGVVGNFGGVVGWLDRVYRSADILLTPNIIATRVIREAMASGLPIVAPIGCKYTPFKAEPRDYKAFASAINDCYRNVTNNYKLDLCQKALDFFDPKKSAKILIDLCKKVLELQPVKIWNAFSITEDDWEVLQIFINERNIKNVVEFGSGVSTILLDRIGVKVTSFETMPKIMRDTRKNATRTKFVMWNGIKSPKLNGNFDMAFIDGPHGGKNREPAYMSVAESDINIVACHDVGRPEDFQWIDKYFKYWKPRLGTNNLLILERV